MTMPHILADELSVVFPTFENSKRSLKNAIIGAPLTRMTKTIRSDGVHALEGLTFNIRNGERVGLVGHNGSGKTTLLRALSGIYHPSFGSLKVEGSVATLLDLSSGFDPDASGYENIFLRSILFGKTKAQTTRLVDAIVEFSELGEFINLPIRTYSSGMVMRLAFSIATSINPDILLMDEWLSVGDADFNVKASARLRELISNASILVIASHDPGIISNICTRVISLEGGRITSDEAIG